MGGQLQKETLFHRKKKESLMNVLPALHRPHSPSPATSSPKTGESSTSSQLPPFDSHHPGVTQSFVWG